jgi:hypothetical protein
VLLQAHVNLVPLLLSGAVAVEFLKALLLRQSLLNGSTTACSARQQQLQE